MKGVMHCSNKGKLSSKYLVPFKILDKVRNVSYRLALLPNLGHIHPVFHISILRKYLSNPSHVLQPQAIEVDQNLAYEEVAVKILYQ